MSLENEAVNDVEAGGRHSVFVTASKVYSCGDSSSG